jgi:uridine phosphorylase
MKSRAAEVPPILRGKRYGAPSVFTAEALLREARRQKRIGEASVPEICLLDPDGDILRHLKAARQAKLAAQWACYHTELYQFERDGATFGIVACVVGAAFAVLVAEELFASGCKLLLSMTSAGQIVPIQSPPYFVIIDRALRDEGTSYHYLPSDDYSSADASLVSLAQRSLAQTNLAVHTGATWTTDAPFRETAEAIAAAREAGLLAVEMEAAALYAFALARRRQLLCFAHVTNQMGLVDRDFEKGVADGAQDSLTVLSAVALGWKGTAPNALA